MEEEKGQEPDWAELSNVSLVCGFPSFNSNASAPCLSPFLSPSSYCVGGSDPMWSLFSLSPVRHANLFSCVAGNGWWLLCVCSLLEANALALPVPHWVPSLLTAFWPVSVCVALLFSVCVSNAPSDQCVCNKQACHACYLLLVLLCPINISAQAVATLCVWKLTFQLSCAHLSLLANGLLCVCVMCHGLGQDFSHRPLP